MKNLITLLLFISCSFAYAQVAVTRTSGGKVVLSDNTEHTVTLTNTYMDSQCMWVTVEVISCNAAGVQITVNPSSTTSTTWTNINANAAGSKTLHRYCFQSTNPYRPEINLRLKGTASDVIKISY